MLIAGFIQPLMPVASLAGAMFYVVEELIPEAHLGEHSIGTLGVLSGFLVDDFRCRFS